jgi:Flp pilus assembly protein CpaB
MHYTNTHVATELVPVMAHNVGPYTVLQSKDVVTQQEVVGSKQSDSIGSPADAAGKMTTVPLYQGDQINVNSLVNPEQVNGKQIVAVNIDLARGGAGYLRPGDTCDVWWIPASGNDQTPGIGWVEVAANAAVVDIKDGAGKSLFAAAGNTVQEAIAASSGTPGSPAVAVLAVNSSDMSRMIGGAEPKSQNIVLTKKFNNAAEAPVTQIVGQQGGAQVVQ